MGIIRPATPGFLVTCVATALLAAVSFCVPIFKSVFFLKANISVGGNNGTITFGTLGYCLELSNGTSCSKPTVGYELDINSLVGNKLPIEIPQVVVKWLTYCLVLHIVALALSAGSAVFGLLAHIREMSMACMSTCISGFAAAIALLAFIFDIAIFFAAKARINAIGSAEIGNATWLTLAAWVLLFFSGCFYTIGRCCVSKRGPRNNKWDKVPDPAQGPAAGSDQMRLDAVKAEADRKARQNAVEGGLPAFHEVQPLTAHIDGDKVYVDDPSQPSSTSAYNGHPTRGNGYSGGGYVQAPAGSRAVDEYYASSKSDASSTYPPAPQHSGSHPPTVYASNIVQNAAPRRQASGYAQSQYSDARSTYAPQTSSPPPTSQYLPPMPQHQYNDPYGQSSRDYGHTAGGSSYHTAVSHNQQPSNYSNYDPYEQQQQYNYQTPSAAANYPPSPSNYYQSQPVTSGTSHRNEHSYSLDGVGYNNDGYNTNVVSTLPNPNSYTHSPPPIATTTGYVVPAQKSPVKGPRAFNQMAVRNEDDAPPMYEAGTSDIQGAWGKH